jgi:hypothetical protein
MKPFACCDVTIESKRWDLAQIWPLRSCTALVLKFRGFFLDTLYANELGTWHYICAIFSSKQREGIVERHSSSLSFLHFEGACNFLFILISRPISHDPSYIDMHAFYAIHLRRCHPST